MPRALGLRPTVIEGPLIVAGCFSGGGGGGDDGGGDGGGTHSLAFLCEGEQDVRLRKKKLTFSSAP